MKNRPSALRSQFFCSRAGPWLLFLSLSVSFAQKCAAQSSLTQAASIRDFIGTYKEQSSEKRVRVLEKDGRLICESADGLSITLFHLVQLASKDAFQIEEATGHQELKFFRSPSGIIAGVYLGGDAYLRLAPRDLVLPALGVPGEPLRSPAPHPGPTPRLLRQELTNRTGDFGNHNESDIFLILERAGRFFIRDSSGVEHPLTPLAFVRKGDQTSFTYVSNDDADPWVIAFEQYKFDPIWQIFTHIGPYHRLPYSVPLGSPNVVRVKPPRPLVLIRNEAMAANPPEEKGAFRKSDLVDLALLDPAIHLDIRYATSNNFLGMPVYTQARAFLQRLAADALLRVLRRLEPLGYGLLIHDGYRPWYVTKIFWDATPADGKIFVADPAQGSRHNRGCAVDLTLYDLKTGQPVEMTGLYDEMSPRSFPDYPGGTSMQRWHRDLLRWAMESESFTVFESEWWHFDYKDWREYAIGNVPFEKLNVRKN